MRLTFRLKLFRYFILPLLVFGILTFVALIIWRRGEQQGVRNRIKITSAEGIDSIEKVQLGGIDQWVLLRGHNKTNPVMLFLHGGPGFPEMPFSHLNADLEKEFVVVHWDQRGAGKSCPVFGAKPPMNVEQFVSDARDIVVWLKKRLNVDKVYLVAHSWGSMFGALTVARYPELFHAYIGIGQIAGLPETQNVRYDFAINMARREGNTDAVGQLEEIGRPPHEDFNTCAVMEKWVRHYATLEHSGFSKSKLVWLAFISPEYSWLDLVKIPLGVRFSFRALWREMFYNTNLFSEAPQLQVPVYFFLGRYDRVATTEVSQQYFNVLDAPRGKQIIWFEHSGHLPHLEEDLKYRESLSEVLHGSEGKRLY